MDGVNPLLYAYIIIVTILLANFNVTIGIYYVSFLAYT